MIKKNHIEKYPLIIHVQDEYTNKDGKSIKGVDRGTHVMRIPENKMFEVIKFLSNISVEPTDYRK